jgi:hypothetical protein
MWWSHGTGCETVSQAVTRHSFEGAATGNSESHDVRHRCNKGSTWRMGHRSPNRSGVDSMDYRGVAILRGSLRS